MNMIRNFCIIAHIDHGKSTLADRLIEMTQTVHKRNMQAQFLDSMDIERERGITIKMQAIKLQYLANDGNTYELNLIDTPGHVDFSYEVSRSLAACEGALLLVDAAQGIEAQTLANFYLALEHDLEIVPVINKIDLPSANPDEVAQEIEHVFGIPREDCIRCSAKTGDGVADILEAIVNKMPPALILEDNTLKALVFDAHYDSYRGVIIYIRLFSGSIQKKQRIRIMASGNTYDVTEVGVFKPALTPISKLKAGDVGYVISNMKKIDDAKIGDTITLDIDPALTPLEGYKEAKPMVFCGFYPIDTNEYELLKDALEKLKLNDSSLQY
ncbi:MAG: GTP-binding protein, partial [Candidatus Margulisbacteria bacterium]|nr:GTP-binding protein [Candidatus Margulisiibacteriota bacterium]